LLLSESRKGKIILIVTSEKLLYLVFRYLIIISSGGSYDYSSFTGEETEAKRSDIKVTYAQ
jgi:hypothetical protein